MKMSDSVTQDLDRYMDEQEQQELEGYKELEQAEDLVADLHTTIYSLKDSGSESDAEVIYYGASNVLTITVCMSEVEGEVFLESLSRKSTDKYIVEKTWIDNNSSEQED
tara:strand:- start:2537 stop:2863 length:327 start_codon:yes stop_codon:yes gene_type:complete